MYALLVVLLQVLYALCVLGLAVYGVHALALTWVARRRIRQGDAVCATSAEQGAPHSQVDDSDTELPFVTIQLPIYNERHVIERLIEACVRQDYPRTRLEIQVLDDSTDQTRVLVTQTVQRWQEAGYNISAVHRADRTGYKAGALAHALRGFAGRSFAHAESSIFGDDGVAGLLNDEASLALRNRAAHDEVLSREDAQTARAWALAILARV